MINDEQSRVIVNQRLDSLLSRLRDENDPMRKAGLKAKIDELRALLHGY